jgi:DNA-binding MarR family transcriptional regulator
MTSRDRVDELMAQWADERPDLDHTVMASVGRLVRVSELIDRRFDRHAARYGLTRNDADVLFTLRRSGPSLPTRLTAGLLVASGTMTARLDRLEAKGLIERRPNPDDRRSTRIALTRRGHEVTEEAIGEHVAHEERLLAGLTKRERAQLDDLLRKLLAHVQELD